MSSLERAGKTAPRLLQDISLYDPANPPASERNLLADVPPVFADSQNGVFEWISQSACRHNFISKINQTYLPAEEQRQAVGTTSRVSAVCAICRYHLQMVVTYTGGAGQYMPEAAGHIHHLVYKSGRHFSRTSRGEVASTNQRVETFHFDCSHPQCGTRVSLRWVSPLLGPAWTRILTDPELLAARTDEAIAANPERLEGIPRPLPINVLDNLRTYIYNALHESARSKPISAINKRFVVCFGVDGRPCKELLEFLGFSSKDDGFWQPPQADPTATTPYQDEASIFLDDAVHELSILIDQRPAAEKKVPYAIPTTTPASNDLARALGVQNYPKASRMIDFQMPSTPCYEDLGTIEDMSSSSIIEAYHQQVSVNPTRAPHYLQCLKTIADLRGGSDREEIEQAVMLAYSEGRYTPEDVFHAYKYFGLDPHDPHLTEETIIAKFYVFLGSTTQETETRTQLWRIGDWKRNERIKSAAEDRVSTVEQACVFLGVEENTADDFVMTMYTAKITDSPGSKDLARRAVELIAEARKSDALKHFLQTGEARAGEMDIGDAYRLLQIPDRTADDGAILAAYTICVDEAPNQMELYSRALSIIAKETNSPLLSSYVSGSAVPSDRDLATWPVGLQNIGNTCYLNSLLQFLFTVRPYRQMVLDFDNFKTDLDEQSLKNKKVGSRIVSKSEVERSQKFLKELRILFQNMITSPKPAVRPEQELARLTLISSTNEAEIRRRSTISGRRPTGLGELNGMPIIGPLGPPTTVSTDPTVSQTASSATIGDRPKQLETSDKDSEATLVSESTTTENPLPLTSAQDKENEPPSTAIGSGNEPAPVDLMDLGGGTPVKTDSLPEHVEPPTRPPPVPPRPSETDRQRQLIEEVELGAQQDVTEVINNVLFQSECAIKPRSIAPDGEQLDQIKDLFYGKTISYITAEKGTRSKEELWSDIKVDVATGSRDIYAAIDGAFDVQNVFVDGETAEQYGSISKLPPILQIQVQRVQFDPIKKASFKSTHHLELRETIYLDRYMNSQKSELMSRRRECWAWKDRLRVLEARKSELLRSSEPDRQDVPSLLTNAKGVVEELASMKEEPDKDALEVDSEIATEVEQLSNMTKSELAYIESEIKDTQAMIASQFVDYKRLAYRLYAVFMHQGSAEFGHYYIYIFDFHKGVWRKYNDNEVTEVQNSAEIFENTNRPNPPTPYFLVYVNDAMKERLVEPVCREIMETSTSQAGNQPPPVTNTDSVVMNDGKTTVTTTEDVDMDPPSYSSSWPPQSTTVIERPPARSTTDPVSPTSIPTKRKGLEEDANVTKPPVQST